MQWTICGGRHELRGLQQRRPRTVERGELVPNRVPALPLGGALRGHITSAVWAAVITALSAELASVWPPVLPTTLHWLGTLGELVPMLAIYTLAIAGRKGGPEGLPPIPEIILLTFVVWWVIVEVVRALWRRLRARHVIRPA